MSGLSYSLKENEAFDRKNRLHCSCFLYAKICTHEHADALGECLQALGSVRITHTQAHSFVPFGKHSVQKARTVLSSCLS